MYTYDMHACTYSEHNETVKRVLYGSLVPRPFPLIELELPLIDLFARSSIMAVFLFCLPNIIII